MRLTSNSTWVARFCAGSVLLLSFAGLHCGGDGPTKGGAGSGGSSGNGNSGGSPSTGGTTTAGSSSTGGASSGGGPSTGGKAGGESSGGSSSGGSGSGGTPGSGGTGGSGTPEVPPPQNRLLVAYYPGWASLPRNIPVEKLTHINYAFANINTNFECFFPSSDDTANTAELVQLKQQNPNLKLLLSVGGWTWSGRFSDAALSAETRTKFAESCVRLMKQIKFDGLDIDWEFPVAGGLPGNVERPEDKHNYTLLLNELRRVIDVEAKAAGTDYLLTVAVSARYKEIANLELPNFARPLNFVNVMTYDYHGEDDKITNFNAPLRAAPGDPGDFTGDPQSRVLFNLESTFQLFEAGGIPKRKLIVGVPFYGHSWSGIESTDNGLFQPGTYAGSLTYRGIVKNYLPTYQRFVHDQAGVPWLYNAEKKIFVTYDDPESIGRKTSYAMEKDYGGVMLWDLTQDTAEWALLNAIIGKLK